MLNAAGGMEGKDGKRENASGMIEKHKRKREGVERWLLEHDLLRS